MRVNTLLEQVLFFKDLAKNELNSVVMEFEDFTELLSSTVALSFFKHVILSGLQVSSDDTPKSLKNPLSHNEVVPEFGESGIKHLGHASKRLTNLILSRSVFFSACRMYKHYRQPISEPFLE